ncbi:syntaxin-18-like [Oppia nitens]|uniref:syntaxin-18-like n=1 Tax=Oppia nitens TaxID=1686743 RepID=UPI0023D9AB39|nr:syntaxin-18-like [Oppia nitens]
MDITKTFSDCLQSIISTNKAIHEMTSNDNVTNNVKKLKSSLNSNNIFSKNAKDLVKSITDMKKYLLDNRNDYINIYSPLLSLASMMTDKERDEIDEDVEQFIKICNEKAIKCLRNDVKRGVKNQLSNHQNIVIDLIEKYLKSVCDIHSQQKAIRIKRAVEKQRLLRLGYIITNKSTENIVKQDLNSSDNKENFTPNEVINDSLNDIEIKSEIPIESNQLNNNEDTYQQLELSKHELQVFEEENQHLYEDMNSLSSEVKDIEMKVVEIARLQEIFTDNVLKQEVDLNKVSDVTISSTENIREGNQQLREAMKKNAGFRVWILFFITTLAFTILFLDWYND